MTTNTTQLQNPSFPATYSVGGTCVYLVKRQSDNICQIRSVTLVVHYHSITFKRVHNTSYVISGLTLSSSALATAPAPRLDVLQAPQTSSASQPLTRSNTHLCAVIFLNNTVSSVNHQPTAILIHELKSISKAEHLKIKIHH